MTNCSVWAVSCDLFLFVCLSLFLCLDRAPGCSVVSLPTQNDCIINQANLVPVWKELCSSQSSFPLKSPYPLFHCENQPAGTIFPIRRASTWAERMLTKGQQPISASETVTLPYLVDVTQSKRPRLSWVRNSNQKQNISLSLFVRDCLRASHLNLTAVGTVLYSPRRFVHGQDCLNASVNNCLAGSCRRWTVTRDKTKKLMS